jgi:hypothetical protein
VWGGVFVSGGGCPRGGGGGARGVAPRGAPRAPTATTTAGATAEAATVTSQGGRKQRWQWGGMSAALMDRDMMLAAVVPGFIYTVQDQVRVHVLHSGVEAPLSGADGQPVILRVVIIARPNKPPRSCLCASPALAHVYSSHTGSTSLDERPQTHTEPASS